MINRIEPGLLMAEITRAQQPLTTYYLVCQVGSRWVGYNYNLILGLMDRGDLGHRGASQRDLRIWPVVGCFGN